MFVTRMYIYSRITGENDEYRCQIVPGRWIWLNYICCTDGVYSHVNIKNNDNNSILDIRFPL